MTPPSPPPWAMGTAMACWRAAAAARRVIKMRVILVVEM
jgi:hypothetical protein